MAEDHLRALDAVPLPDLGGAGVAELVRIPGVPPMPVSQVGTLLIGQPATTLPLPCASTRLRALADYRASSPPGCSPAHRPSRAAHLANVWPPRPAPPGR